MVIRWSRFARMKFQPVQPAQVLPYDKMGESNFILAKRDSSQSGICVDLFTFPLIFICKHVINYFFIPLRQTETIAQENFVPAVQKRDPALPRWNFSHVIEGYNLWRVYSTIGILANETESHPGIIEWQR